MGVGGVDSENRNSRRDRAVPRARFHHTPRSWCWCGHIESWHTSRMRHSADEQGTDFKPKCKNYISLLGLRGRTSRGHRKQPGDEFTRPFLKSASHKITFVTKVKLFACTVLTKMVLLHQQTQKARRERWCRRAMRRAFFCRVGGCAKQTQKAYNSNPNTKKLL